MSPSVTLRSPETRKRNEAFGQAAKKRWQWQRQLKKLRQLT
jgi:hypothetical protein